MANYEQDYSNVAKYLAKWESQHRAKGRYRNTTMSAAPYAPLLLTLMNTLDPNWAEGERVKGKLRRILKNKSILEIGANQGLFVDFLNQHGARASGIDLDSDAVRVARMYNHIPVENKDAHDLNEDRRYDVILSKDFFDPAYVASDYYKHDIEGITRNIARALKENGHSIHVVCVSNTSTLEPLQMAKHGLKPDFHNEIKIKANGTTVQFHASVARRVK